MALSPKRYVVWKRRKKLSWRENPRKIISFYISTIRHRDVQNTQENCVSDKKSLSGKWSREKLSFQFRKLGTGVLKSMAHRKKCYSISYVMKTFISNNWISGYLQTQNKHILDLSSYFKGRCKYISKSINMLGVTDVTSTLILSLCLKSRFLHTPEKVSDTLSTYSWIRQTKSALNFLRKDFWKYHKLGRLRK
jgi:hypothetical protein